MVVICSICKGSLALPPRTLANGTRIEPAGNQQGESKYEPHAIAPMCGHLFHSTCLAEWFAKNGERKCPVCSCMIPPDQMTKIYLSTGPDSGKSESDLGSNVNSNNTSDPSGAVTTVDSPSVQDPSSLIETTVDSITDETMPLQISETTVNGVRTVVYRFSLSSDTTKDNNDTASSQLNQHQNSQRRRESRGRSRNRQNGNRQENPDRSRSPHRCHNCSTLERIQALMMKEMADLKRVVTEQKAMIASLEQALKFPSGASMNLRSSGLVDVNANLM